MWVYDFFILLGSSTLNTSNDSTGSHVSLPQNLSPESQGQEEQGCGEAEQGRGDGQADQADNRIVKLISQTRSQLLKVCHNLIKMELIE